MDGKKSDGYKRIPIKIEIYNKIKEEHKIRNIEYSVSRWVSDLLLMNIEKYEYLRLYAPYISYKGVHENELFLRDEKLDRIVEVVLKDRTLFCRYCNKDDCIHIHYALVLPELGRLVKYSKNKI
ncbi:MAG: hypothetical protein NZ888_06335 [Candidatus Nitrosocaldus sp.]|nr:hypothetical protein [Candidatus Nitrosocaldus sp.]MCS7141785.1 hypothetical protein [Candidatus Nitrosocaldus sp.]MDW8000461.1 hypothetical protein [Candidatus Nitrosocaldus sp.]